MSLKLLPRSLAAVFLLFVLACSSQPEIAEPTKSETALDFSQRYLELVKQYQKRIEADPNDNKFVDCAVAARADYIVTEDKHFNELRKVSFPKINVIGVDEFRQCLERSQDKP